MNTKRIIFAFAVCAVFLISTAHTRNLETAEEALIQEQTVLEAPEVDKCTICWPKKCTKEQVAKCRRENRKKKKQQ